MVRINSTYENAIYTFISNITSATTVWMQQDVKSPSLPYVGMNITSFGITDGYPSQTSDGDDNFTKHLKKTMIVSISTYGDTAATLADLITDGFYNQTEIDLLKDAGLYLRAISDPIPLAIVIDGVWEQRYSLDITLGYEKDITTNIGYIDRASGTILDKPFDTNDY